MFGQIEALLGESVANKDFAQSAGESQMLGVRIATSVSVGFGGANAFPLPKARAALTGDVATPKPRRIRIVGIRERRHSAVWDTLVRTPGKTLAYARSKLKRKDQ